MRTIFIALYSFFFLLVSQIQAQTPASQPCYQSLNNLSGYPASTPSPVIESAACDLQASFGAYNTQFSVVHAALYLHANQTQEGVAPYIDSIQKNIAAQVPYHLLFIWISNSDKTYQDVHVTVKAPEGGFFACLTDEQREGLSAYIQEATQTWYANNGAQFILYGDAEVSGINRLKGYCEKLANCCTSNFSMSSNDCSICPDVTDAYNWKAYFEGNCFAKIPIEVIHNLSSKPDEVTEMSSSASIENYVQDNIRFRPDDPDGNLYQVMGMVFESDLFKDFTGEIKGFITDNNALCTPGRLGEIKSDYNSEREVSLWLHIWEDPQDLNATDYLYIGSLVSKDDLCAGDRPDLKAGLYESYQYAEGEFKYNNRFEQSASVVMALATSRCPARNELTTLPTIKSASQSANQFLCTNPLPEDAYFFSPAQIPILVPKGASLVFGTQVANEWHFDSRALAGFATGEGRWYGCGQQFSDQTSEIIGFFNFSKELSVYNAQPAGYKDNVWWCFESPNRQIIKYKINITDPGSLNQFAGGISVLNFNNGEPTSEVLDQTIKSGALKINQLNSYGLTSAYVNSEKGVLAKIPIDNSTFFDYYIINKNYIDPDKIYKYDCYENKWVLLVNDPFASAQFGRAIENLVKYGPWVGIILSRMQDLRDFVLLKPDIKHDALDLVGLFFPPADIANAIIYAVEGEYGLAALAATGAVIENIGFIYQQGKKYITLNKVSYETAIDGKLNILRKIIVPCAWIGAKPGVGEAEMATNEPCYKVLDLIVLTEKVDKIVPEAFRERFIKEMLSNAPSNTVSPDKAFELAFRFIDDAEGEIYHTWEIVAKAFPEGSANPFLNDFEKLKALHNDLQNLPTLATELASKPELVKAWDFVNTATAATSKKRLSVDILKSVDKHLGDETFINIIGGNNIEAGRAAFGDLINKYTGKCQACGVNLGSPYLPNDPGDYIDKVVELTKRYSDKNGISIFNEAKGAFYSQDGAWHAMKQLESLDASKVKKIDARFEGEDLPCEGCRFDVEFIEESNLKFIEYKSYLNASKIPLQQFKDYLFKVTSLDQFKYIFNSAKLSETNAKNGMKTFLKNNAESLFQELGEIKMQQLFEILGGEFDNVSQFKNLLETNTTFADNAVKFVSSQ